MGKKGATKKEGEVKVTKTKPTLKDSPVDLAGTPIKIGNDTLTFGRAIALALVSRKSDDPLRAYVLAKEINELSDAWKPNSSDRAFIIEALKGFPDFSDMVSGQVIDFLDQI